MMVLVVYDISTKDIAGAGRLRKIAKLCAEYGVPVQNSVYEIETDAGRFRAFDKKVKKIINKDDNVRYYMLGNRYQTRIVNVGKEKVRWDRENYIV